MYRPSHFENSLASLEKQAKSIPIIKAMDEGNLIKLKQLISNGEDVNVHAPGGEKTPLHIACEYKNLEFVKAIIVAGAYVNATTKRGFTPLHVAAQLGATNIVELLCTTPGIDINFASDTGCTPLHESAIKGHIQTTLTLLRFKADPNIKDNQYSLTAANLAHNAGHEKVRDLIIELMTYEQEFIQNVNNNLFIAKKSCLGNSAAYKFFTNISDALVGIEDGDTVFKVIKTHLTSVEYEPLKITLSKVRNLLVQNMNLYNQDKLNNKNIDPSAALNAMFIKACKHGLVNLISTLLKNSLLDPAFDDNYGIRSAASMGHLDVVQLLLEDPRVNPAAKGNCAIAWACENGNADVVRLLLKDPRVTPVIDNYYALVHSVKNGHAEVVKLLLADPRIDFKADSIEVDSNTGVNYSIAAALINCASNEGHAEIVKLLLNDPRINPAIDNNYPICVASKKGHLEVVKLLITDPRVNPMVDNKYPIRAALENRHFEIVRLLILPSTPNLSNVEGAENLVNSILLKEASAAGDTEFVKFLMESGIVSKEVDGLDKKFDSNVANINLSASSIPKKGGKKRYKR